MLVDFQTLFAPMSGNQLDLTVGESPRREIRDHLMTKEMRMHVLCDPCLVAIVFDDLLDAAGRKQSVAGGLKEIAIFGIGP